MYGSMPEDFDKPERVDIHLNLRIRERQLILRRRWSYVLLLLSIAGFIYNAGEFGYSLGRYWSGWHPAVDLAFVILYGWLILRSRRILADLRVHLKEVRRPSYQAKSVEHAMATVETVGYGESFRKVFTN